VPIAPRREIFPVHSYEVDAFGILEVPALAGYLQEVAGAHAAELGVGIDVLMRQGLTWVLSRQRLVIASPIALGERVEIATWPSGIDRLTALREFEVRREDGTEVARASTQWLVLDLASRRPVRPEKVLDPRFPRERSAPVAPPADGKLPALAHWDAERRFHVRYSDIDHNLHVNNTSYLAWALEAIDRDLWRSSRVAEIEAQFLAEGQAGSAILSRLARRGQAELAHSIVQEEDGRELARVTTRWVGREAR
jgi:acyl-ACP thioesterase